MRDATGSYGVVTDQPEARGPYRDRLRATPLTSYREVRGGSSASQRRPRRRTTCHIDLTEGGGTSDSVIVSLSSAAVTANLSSYRNSVGRRREGDHRTSTLERVIGSAFDDHRPHRRPAYAAGRCRHTTSTRSATRASAWWRPRAGNDEVQTSLAVLEAYRGELCQRGRI